VFRLGFSFGQKLKYYYLGMSIEQLGEKDFARRNLWEATLFDHNHIPLLWSTGLIKSTNIPKLRFNIEDIHAGTSKGYLGWNLPDNLSINIWETSDHQVEKYLDEWMIGKTGVFNPDSGAFRIQPNEGYIYRDVQIKTFIYEYTEGTPYQAKRKEVISALRLAMIDGIQEITGPVSVDQKEYIQGVSEIAVNEIERTIANQHTSTFVPQHTQGQSVLTVDRKQVIPVLNKVTAAIGILANQAMARIPFSNITRALVPPVIIPPPLMRVPVSTGTPVPQFPVIRGKFVNLQDRIVPSSQSRTKTIRQAIDEEKQIVARQIIDGVQERVEEVLVQFASGEAVNAKRWRASERTTSLVTYSTAIEGYDIGIYDYSTGEGVSYTVNLGVRDIRIEYPV